jgi:hypothetical protein
MPRKLTKLRIDEVSSVNRGAGEGVKVMLLKRDNGDAVLKHDNGDYSYLPSWAAKDLTDTLPPQPMLFNDIMLAKLSEEREDDGDTVPPDKLEQMIAAMIAAAPSLRREDAADFLMHTPRGRRLAEFLSEHFTKTRKEEPIMDRSQELRDIAKAAGGMEMICKNIIDHGTTTITETEFSDALTEHCKAHRRDGESVVKAFSRTLEEDISVRRAYGIAKGYPNMMSVEPVSVEVGSSATADDSAKAFSQLQELIAEQRKRSPTLADAKLYEMVFAANPALVKASVWHPPATT